MEAGLLASITPMTRVKEFTLYMKTINAFSTLNYAQIKSVALPSEHGGWGFLLEPILLGLIVAGSAEGLILSAATLSAFLVHQPLKLALKDRLKRRRSLRSAWAERFAAGYGLLALILLGIVGLTFNPRFFVPLLLALPFLLIQIIYDARNRGRALIPELCGAITLGSTASAVAILGGWSLWAALPLWLVVGSRSVPSILYVRTRLKLEHGKPIRPYPTWIAHGVALLIVTLMAIAGLVPTALLAAFIVLLARALIGLSGHRKPRPAKQIGFFEIAYGLIVVALAAAGYTLTS